MTSPDVERFNRDITITKIGMYISIALAITPLISTTCYKTLFRVNTYSMILVTLIGLFLYIPYAFFGMAFTGEQTDMYEAVSTILVSIFLAYKNYKRIGCI